MSTMKLRVLFGQRKESYPGEHAPEVLYSATEYEVEENPDMFPYQERQARKMYHDEFIGFAVVDIEVDQDEVRRLCLERPTLKGNIVSY